MFIEFFANNKIYLHIIEFEYVFFCQLFRLLLKNMEADSILAKR